MKSQDEWILAAYGFGMETAANLVFDLIDEGVRGDALTGAGHAAGLSCAGALSSRGSKQNGWL